jgi:hypothetical protein
LNDERYYTVKTRPTFTLQRATEKNLNPISVKEPNPNPKKEPDPNPSP